MIDRQRERRAELELLRSQRKLELDGPEAVKAYVQDLHRFLAGDSLAERRAFMKSFVREIRVEDRRATVTYTFPTPPDHFDIGKAGVLSTVLDSGRYCTIDRTFELSFKLDG